MYAVYTIQVRLDLIAKTIFISIISYYAIDFCGQGKVIA